MPTLVRQTRRLLRHSYDAGVSAIRSADNELRCRGRHTFVDRSSGAGTLVVVLAGYKHELWPAVFPRIEKNVPADADVCVVSAGRRDHELADLAARNSWSYLSTAQNDVGLIQNVAIAHHPEAQTVVKVDEDMLLPERVIPDLVDFHGRLRSEGVVNPAFTAPTININGFCYRGLLAALGILQEFEALFGSAQIATRGIAATENVEAAQWIWERTGPVDHTAKILRERSPDLQMSGIQFSIGLIAFDRSFWDEIGHFPVYRHRLAVGKSTLGADEEYICRQAIFGGRPMVVAPHLFAGHFSFGRQYDGVLDLFRSQPALFG